MRTYDLRNAGDGCINNPALALLDVFAKGESPVQVIVKKDDIPLKILKDVARTCGYTVKSSREENGLLVAVLERV